MSAGCQLRVPGKDPELPPIDTAATWNGGFSVARSGKTQVTASRIRSNQYRFHVKPGSFRATTTSPAPSRHPVGVPVSRETPGPSAPSGTDSNIYPIHVITSIVFVVLHNCRCQDPRRTVRDPLTTSLQANRATVDNSSTGPGTRPPVFALKAGNPATLRLTDTPPA